MTDLDLLDDLEAQDRAAAPYTGAAPLTFTSAYFTPEELIEAHKVRAEKYAHVPWADRPRQYTWHLSTEGWCNEAPGHRFCLLSVDLRCDCRFPYLVAEWEQIGPCYCPGDLMFQANCPGCRWHAIRTSENAAVEAWHDHAWPGWRDLPVVPMGVRPHGGGMSPRGAVEKKAAKKACAWVAERYPAEWQAPGAPVLTERDRIGTRHVPGYSPWGGFDMCGLIVEEAAS